MPRMFRRLAICLMLLLLPVAALAHIGGHASDHYIILHVLGDRLALEYGIEGDDHADGDNPQARANRLAEQSAQLQALQVIEFDKYRLTLHSTGVRERGDEEIYYFDTGPGSLPAGAHRIHFRSLSAMLAQRYEVSVTAGEGGELPGGDIAPAMENMLDFDVEVDGQAPQNINETTFDDSGAWNKLSAMIRDKRGLSFWPLALLFSLVFGMIHALGPGHGKMLTAAYLIDRKGGARDALTFSLSVTFAHTLFAFLIGFFALLAKGSFDHGMIGPWLSIVAGVIMTGIGLWMLIGLWRGRHGHVEGEHSHPHRHEHSTPLVHDHVHKHEHDHQHEQKPRLSTLRTILLGISGGLAPCPEGIALVLLAVSAGRPGAGLIMVTVYSLGLATVLFIIGLAACNATPLLTRLFGRDTDRWGFVLSVISAVLVMVIGIGFTWIAASNL